MTRPGRMAGIICALMAIGSASLNAADSWDHPPKRKDAFMEHRTFQSASMRIPVGYNVCVPADYIRDRLARYPVIYYLHGFKGNESSYLEYARYWKEGLRATGPALLVFVNAGETSFYSDSPDGAVMGEAVVKELVAEVDAKFRTVPEPAMRALHGYSMGGFGALKLAFKYPDLFGSAAAYGATLFTAQEMQKEAGKLYKSMFGSAERFNANSPPALLDRNAEKLRGHTSIALVVGTKDEFLKQNQQLAQRLKALKIEQEYIELPSVKHDKDPLYDQAAAKVFEFTGRVFRSRPQPGKGR